MQYEKPEVTALGSGLTEIRSGCPKIFVHSDTSGCSTLPSDGAYESDE
jgi:hypothetical protein